MLIYSRFPGFDDKNDLAQIGLGCVAAHHALTVELAAAILLIACFIIQIQRAAVACSRAAERRRSSLS